MAKIRTFFGPDTSGKDNRIQVQTLFWITVGSGKYVTFEDYRGHFMGHFSILGIFQGNVDLDVELLDHNPDSRQGPCMINKYKGTYEVKVDELPIDIEYPGNPYHSVIKHDDGGTFIYGLQLPIWVGP